jgi:hypothetical protein
MACNIARSPNQASQAASGSAELHCHQALAYMGADAIVNRYRRNPGALL